MCFHSADMAPVFGKLPQCVCWRSRVPQDFSQLFRFTSNLWQLLFFTWWWSSVLMSHPQALEAPIVYLKVWNLPEGSILNSTVLTVAFRELSQCIWWKPIGKSCLVVTDSFCTRFPWHSLTSLTFSQSSPLMTIESSLKAWLFLLIPSMVHFSSFYCSARPRVKWAMSLIFPRKCSSLSGI